uniref:Activator of Hsp90 ATPase AHSA1-like N-terminal domain-containing protein n=1 Tax=Rousettus aegyptiacus TaxID=9407 RepID=A0A7J8FDS9_ROUAE|nr:hypothetical protein HJG63_000474 [Rousettus aegyptiacus]
MAKGSKGTHGDPCWVVEEREDGANVNNWHCPWQGGVERDTTSWSKGNFHQFLVGIVVESEAGRCQISELKQLEGEASCSNRKGKTIFFYEWNIKLGWKGIIKESGTKHKGLIEIPNLSEENEVDDTEVNVNKKKGDRDILKDLMKTASTANIREVFGDYLKALDRIYKHLTEHYATVALHFVPTLGQTELQLDCKGIPVCKEENMKFCW